MPQVLIAGLGLMGASLAARLSAVGWRVLLHHRRPEVSEAAAAKGWGTQIHDTSSIDSPCIAVVGTPVNVIPGQVRELASNSNLLITDMGSTKSQICHQLQDVPNFIGSHPMCGSHLQGFANADPSIFTGATSIITPTPAHQADAVERITEMWQAAGCSVVNLAAEQHDLLVAEASHLPHVLASLAARQLSSEGLPIAASGFRDTSRVAAGCPALWTSILLDNAEALQAGIAASVQDLQELAKALAQADADAVQHWLADGQRRRQQFDQQQQ